MTTIQTNKHFFSGSSRILKLAVPAFLTQASFTLTNVIDLVMIGTLGAAAIGSVGIAGITYWNMFIFFGSQTMAVTYLCAQSYGAGKKDELIRRGGAAIVISLFIGIPIALFSPLLSKSIYQLMGAETAILEAGMGYLMYRLIAFPLDLINGVFEGLIKSKGNTKTPMIIRLTSHGVNLIFNYLLIFGAFGFPRLGVTGAGLATMIGHCVAFTLFVPIAFKHFPISLFFKNLPKVEDFRLLFKEGVKIIFNDSSFSLSFMVYTRFVTGLGAVALAANEIAIHVSSLGFMPAVGFGQAAQILIGQHIGAKENGLAKRTGLQVLVFCSIFMVLVSLAFLFLPRQIAGLFTDDGAIIAYMVPMLMISAAFSILDGGQIVLGAALRGTGDTLYLSISSIIISWLFFVPLTYLLLQVLQLSVIWAWGGTYIYMTALFGAFFIRYLFLKWEKIRAK